MSARTHVTVAARESPNVRAWIRMHAYHLAIADIGRGEEPWKPGARVRNNDGPFLVNDVRPNDGTGLDADTKGAWCASWVSAKYTLALRHAREYFDLPALALGFRTTRSALRLGERMAEAGTAIDPIDAQEGDTFFKRRRGGGGHTGFVRGVRAPELLPTLEGNVGVVPALIRPLYQAPADLVSVVRYQ